jgi:hypothetical protein
VQQNNFNAPIPTQDAGMNSDVFATIERLADLRSKGVLTDEEFASKKSELLGRL